MKRFAFALIVVGALAQTTIGFAQTAPAMPTMDHSKMDHTKMAMPMPAFSTSDYGMAIKKNLSLRHNSPPFRA